MNNTKGTALWMSINTLQSIKDWKISSAQPRLKQFFWKLAMLCGSREEWSNKLDLKDVQLEAQIQSDV